MTTVEIIESELEPKLADLSQTELCELIGWLAARARDRGKDAMAVQERTLPEVDEECFERGAADVLGRHQTLLKKLAQ